MKHSLLVWLPRILTVLYAAFISLFAFDVWEMEGSLLARFGGFLVHLVPTAFVFAALVVAWKRPFAGGFLFLGMSLSFALFFGWQEPMIIALFSGPLVLVGLLFLLEGWLERPTVRPRF